MQLCTATSIVTYPFYAQIIKLNFIFSFPFTMILFTIQTLLCFARKFTFFPAVMSWLAYV